MFIIGIDLDLDPEFDPDPHLSKSLDPDLHIMYKDPKHFPPQAKPGRTGFN
jgi:hypothetical protein